MDTLQGAELSRAKQGIDDQFAGGEHVVKLGQGIICPDGGNPAFLSEPVVGVVISSLLAKANIHPRPPVMEMASGD